MKQEYTVGIGWKIFIYVFFGGAAAAISYFFIKALITGDQVAMWTGLFAGALVVLWLCILSTERTKVIITEDSITCNGTFKSRQLLFSEVKGYRMLSGDKGSKTLVIVSKAVGKRDVKIGDPSYFGHSDEMTGFIYGKFKDIDNEEYEDEVTEILNDPAIGINEDDRAQKLQQVTKTARVFNIVGIVLTLWLFVYPHPYPIPVYIALVYPFAALGFFLKNQGLVTLIDGSKKKSAYPSITSSFILVPVALGLRALLDYDLLNFSKFIVPWAVVAAVLIIGLLLLIRQSKNRSLDIMGAVIFSVVFGYGSVVSSNCLFDNVASDLHYARVLDHRISSGKSTSYYLTLSAWGAKPSGEEVSVASDLYYQVSKGDSVTVHIKKGTFNIPWYYITK
jgi:hypothetical protein